MKKIPGDIILLCIHVYHKWRSYDGWFLKQCVTDRNFQHFGPFFAFEPLDNLENQNFNIKKNTWRYYHFTHLHHICMYGSWDMKCHRQNFLSFWTTFCPFTPLWTQKIEFSRKWKKHLKILSICKHKWVIWSMVPQIWSAIDRFFVILPLKFEKIKKHLEILSFYKGVT